MIAVSSLFCYCLASLLNRRSAALQGESVVIASEPNDHNSGHVVNGLQKHLRFVMPSLVQREKQRYLAQSQVRGERRNCLLTGWNRSLSQRAWVRSDNRGAFRFFERRDLPLTPLSLVQETTFEMSLGMV